MFFKKNKREEDRITEVVTESDEPSQSPIPFGAEKGVRGKTEEEAGSASHPHRKRQKTKLRLMTRHEEAERAFATAREHYLTKNLPSLKEERKKKKQNESLQFFLDRVIAIVGFFIIVCLLIWFYNHYDMLMSWWKKLIDKLDLL